MLIVIGKSSYKDSYCLNVDQIAIKYAVFLPDNAQDILRHGSKNRQSTGFHLISMISSQFSMLYHVLNTLYCEENAKLGLKTMHFCWNLDRNWLPHLDNS